MELAELKRIAHAVIEEMTDAERIGLVIWQNSGVVRPGLPVRRDVALAAREYCLSIAAMSAEHLKDHPDQPGEKPSSSTENLRGYGRMADEYSKELEEIESVKSNPALASLLNSHL